MLKHLTTVAITCVATGGLLACGEDDTSTADRPAATTAETQTAAAEFTTVTPAAIAPRAAAGEVLLVDVREDSEWDAGRAPDAIHVPLAEIPGALKRLETQADGKPIAFICRSGNRSGQASQAAVDAGLQDIINVSGGMGEWVAAGLPLVPEDGTVL